MRLSNKTTNILAAAMLATMVVLTFGAMIGDSLTMDEKAHLPAGYSYVTQKDMRLNPEHPPLVKDMAGIPLLFIKNIHFPYDSPAWTSQVNSQWDFGEALLFNSNNPADEMIFWGRLPMIIFLLVLGFYLFYWTRQLFGKTAALIALSLFCFSPTFLAHGHLVTTDTAAAAGIFISLYYFVKALQKPSGKNIVYSGIALGIAELLKFSAILLYPFFFLMTLGCWIIKQLDFKSALKLLAGVYVICFLLIGAVYIFHTANYPPQRQAADSAFILSSSNSRTAANLIIWAADKPILRAYAQYFLGVMMATQRVEGGNTTYFLGQVSGGGWKNYFPIMYFVKETVVFHLLTFIALIYLLSKIKIKKSSNLPLCWKNLTDFIKKYLPQMTILGFLLVYWLASLCGNLNIGVRHLIPVLPLTMILVAGGAAAFADNIRWRRILIALLCLCQIVGALRAYPHYLSYYNILVGGSENGYKIAVDSNTDWGQDLKRLKHWVDQNNIQTIYIDYFGGANVKYYFDGKYQSWWCDRSPDQLPKNSWLAVSATFLQGGRGTPAPESDIKGGCYRWLDNYQPATVIGNSIFVYHIQ